LKREAGDGSGWLKKRLVINLPFKAEDQSSSEASSDITLIWSALALKTAVSGTWLKKFVHH